MSFLSKVMKSAAAKKVIDEARKPQNQAKIKQFVSDYAAKRKGGTPPTHRGRG